jgi:hypothetical protein
MLTLAWRMLCHQHHQHTTPASRVALLVGPALHALHSGWLLGCWSQCHLLLRRWLRSFRQPARAALEA